MADSILLDLHLFCLEQRGKQAIIRDFFLALIPLRTQTVYLPTNGCKNSPRRTDLAAESSLGTDSAFNYQVLMWSDRQAAAVQCREWSQSNKAGGPGVQTSGPAVGELTRWENSVKKSIQSCLGRARALFPGFIGDTRVPSSSHEERLMTHTGFNRWHHSTSTAPLAPWSTNFKGLLIIFKTELSTEMLHSGSNTNTRSYLQMGLSTQKEITGGGATAKRGQTWVQRQCSCLFTFSVASALSHAPLLDAEIDAKRLSISITVTLTASTIAWQF